VAQMKLRLLFVISAVGTAAIGASGCGTQAQHGTQAARRVSTAPSYSAQEKSGFGRTNVFIYRPNHLLGAFIDCVVGEAFQLLDSEDVDVAVRLGKAVCHAYWVDAGHPRWAIHLNRRTWITGRGRLRPAHRDGVAHRLSRRVWRVPTKGSVRFHSPGRWDIYRGRKLVGFTKGPRGVPAGLMWLADPQLDGFCVVVVAPTATTDNLCVEHYP
jgi:hypothetical protein